MYRAARGGGGGGGYNDVGRGGITGTSTQTARPLGAMASGLSSQDPHGGPQGRTPETWTPPDFVPHPADTEFTHRYKGQLQPSVGERLTHAYNFLADEDAGCCPDWEAKLVEAMDYVYFLHHSPMKQRFRKPTLELLDEVRRLLETHLASIKHHSRKPSTPKMPRPDFKMPQASLQPSLRTGGGLGARKVLHRVPTIVNDIVHLFPQWDFNIRQLAASEDAMWSPGPGHHADLAQEEQARYQTGAKKSPYSLQASTKVVDTPHSYAGVRGDRRRGLQTCLNQLDSSENSSAQTVWCRVVPPARASELQIMQRAANRIQFSPIAMPREAAEGRDVGGSPYTRRMYHYWRVFDTWWDQARKKTETDHGSPTVLDGEGSRREDGVQQWVALPRPRVAYVNHGLPSAVDHAREMLKACKAVSGLMNRASAVAPRKLIIRCCELRDLGQEGGQPSAEVVRWRAVDKLEDGGLRLLNETELGFLHLLASPSVNQGMLRQLDVQAPLYLVFADRLQRILDDLSPEALFPTSEAEVSVEQLLAEMHKGTMGVSQKVHFSVHDACCWLERLSEEEGRIRFRLDLTEYGYVSRPFTDLHPEMLVVMPPTAGRPPAGGSGSGESEFDAIGAPRPSEMKSWGEIADDEVDDETGDQAMFNFFCALSYRLGYTCEILRKRVKGARTLGPSAMSRALADWEETADKWRKLTGCPPTLGSVCARVEGATGHGAGSKGPDDAEALRRIRAKVLEEAESNANALYPTRWVEGTAVDGSAVSVPVREPLWDWGQPGIRGWARQYFSLDRYPPELQRPERQAKMRSGNEVDSELLWDPCAADPTAPRWLMRKAKRFGQDKVEYKRGPAIFYGDTVRQKEAIVSHINNTLATALGIPDPASQRPTFLSRLSGYVSLPGSSSQPPARTGLPDSAVLPPVDSSLIPDSSGGMDLDP